MPKEIVMDASRTYYGKGQTECITVIEQLGLPYHLGCVLKYIWRHGKKPGADPIEDLKKAQNYLSRYIELLETRKAGRP